MASRVPNSTGGGGRATPSVRAATRRVATASNAMAAKLCRERSRGRTPSPRRLQVEPSRDAEILTACRAAWDGPGATNALAVAATAAQTISLMIVPSASRDHSRIGPKCTARCNSFPLAARQLQPARIRTPRRVNTSRSTQQLTPNRWSRARGGRAESLPARRATGLGRAPRRNGALAALEPQNGHSSTKRHEHPGSYSYIRLTGRSDAWRDPCGKTGRGLARLHRAFGGARRRIARQQSSTSIIAANNANCRIYCS